MAGQVPRTALTNLHVGRYLSTCLCVSNMYCTIIIVPPAKISLHHKTINPVPSRFRKKTRNNIKYIYVEKREIKIYIHTYTYIYIKNSSPAAKAHPKKHVMHNLPVVNVVYILPTVSVYIYTLHYTREQERYVAW